MTNTEIVLPFVTFKNIKKPGVLDALEDMYDFVIPIYNNTEDRSFFLYFQADVNVDELMKFGPTATSIAVHEMVQYLKTFFESRKEDLEIGRLNTISNFSLSSIIDVILNKAPNRKTVLGSHDVGGGKCAPTINLKLPRGTTMYISAVTSYPDDNIKANSIGTVELFGYTCRFFFKKNNCNITRHVSHSVMQKEFEKAMRDAFSFLEHLGDKALPWNTQLTFL